MKSMPIGYGAIPDPFKPTEAIMPSGKMGAKILIATVGTEKWVQLGWVEPDQIGPPKAIEQ